MPPQTQKSIFHPGPIIADGVGELAEYIFDKLGPLGLTIVGIQPLVDALKAVGANNPAMIHGMDMLAKNVIRRFVTDQNWLIAFYEGFDAYFDRVKLLAKDAKKEQVGQAKGEGLERGRVEFDKWLKKQKEKPSFFSSLLMKLDPSDRDVYVDWVGSLDERAYDRLIEFTKHVESTDELNEVVRYIRRRRDPFALFKSARGHKPGLLETVAAAMRGEETPQVEKARDVVLQSCESTKRFGEEQKAKADAIRARNDIPLVPTQELGWGFWAVSIAAGVIIVASYIVWML